MENINNRLTYLYCRIERYIFNLNYDLEDAIIDRLEFGYNTKIGNNGNENYVRI